jgi:hypothetical protein
MGPVEASLVFCLVPYRLDRRVYVSIHVPHRILYLSSDPT